MMQNLVIADDKKLHNKSNKAVIFKYPTVMSNEIDDVDLYSIIWKRDTCFY